MKRKAGLLIVNASELLTFRGPARARRGAEMGDTGIINDGAVAVTGNVISDVGTTADIRNRYEAAPENTIDADGKTVVPGFIDAHNHLIFAGSRENELLMKLQGRTYMEIHNAGGGIVSTVRATRKASVSQLVTEAESRLLSMLAHGTTTTEAKTGYGLTLKDEYKSLKAIQLLHKQTPVDIVPTFMPAHAIPPEFDGGREYIGHIIRNMLPQARGQAAYCDVFCEEGVFTVSQSRKLLRAAQKLGMGAKLHVDEFVDSGGASLAAELKAVSAEHLLHSSRDGIVKMANAGVIGVLLPVATFTLMKGKYADARGMLENNLALALGTDLCPNSWCESMQFAMQLACYNMRMTPAEALCASTINAAHAIGVGAKVGSIEKGKTADILVLDAPNHLHVAYRMGVNHVEKIIKGGSVVGFRHPPSL